MNPIKQRLAHRHTAQGFTIVEMLLALSGVAFLLLFVVFAIMHVTGLYTKGIALRQINQTGREVTDELARAIRYGGTVVAPDASNRLCVGGKAYIWNNRGETTNKYTDDVPVNFARSDDTSYCADTSKKIDPDASTALIGGVATVQKLIITRSDPVSPLYSISLVVSTSGDNAPSLTGTGEYQCDTHFWQYCAFGQFETVVYARN